MHYSTAEVMIQATCCCCQSEKNLSAELISGIITVTKSENYEDDTTEEESTVEDDPTSNIILPIDIDEYDEDDNSVELRQDGSFVFEATEPVEGCTLVGEITNGNDFVYGGVKEDKEELKNFRNFC